jgi:hypothetical protein
MLKTAQRLIPLTDHGWRIIGTVALLASVATGYIMGVL